MEVSDRGDGDARGKGAMSMAPTWQAAGGRRGSARWRKAQQKMRKRRTAATCARRQRAQPSPRACWPAARSGERWGLLRATEPPATHREEGLHQHGTGTPPRLGSLCAEEKTAAAPADALPEPPARGGGRGRGGIPTAVCGLRRQRRCIPVRARCLDGGEVGMFHREPLRREKKTEEIRLRASERKKKGRL